MPSFDLDFDFTVICECGKELDVTVISTRGEPCVVVTPCETCTDNEIANAKADWESEQ